MQQEFLSWKMLQTKQLGYMLLLAIAYFIAAKLGLALSLVAQNVTLIWPPTGLTLASFLLFGAHLWPGVFIGSFAANFSTGVPFETALGIGIGNTLEGVVGYWLLRRVNFSIYLDTVRDVAALMIYGSLLSTMLSASIGTASLAAGGIVPWQAYNSVWLLWWMGDAMGNLVFAPLLLAWLAKTDNPYDTPRVAEALLLIAILLGVSEFVFGNYLQLAWGRFPIAYITFPFLILAAWRFGQRGATTATLLISGVALWNVVHQVGLFSFETPTKSLSLLWLYANVLSATGLVVAAAVSQRRRAENELRLAASVFENTSEGIIITDAQRHIVSVNQAFSDLSGFSRDEILGKNPVILNSGQQNLEFYRNMWKSINAQGTWTGEIWNRRKNGEVYPCWMAINAIKDVEGNITHYIGISSDITDQKRAEAHIRHLAQHDALTGLPNRTLLLDRITHALEQAERNQYHVGVLFMDLDRFKVVNDTLGHEIGDELLIMVADRLKRCVRQEDTVGRLGGDEFLIVLSKMSHSQDAVLVAQKTVALISEPYMVHDYELHVTISIGISVYPTDGTDAGALMKNADTAMYFAKQTRDTFRFYAAEMNASAYERLKVENSLRHALERNEFVLHYQPLVALESGQIIGTEALIRWQHPEMGLMAPDTFIPIAEETGLIISIGEWVAREACRQCLMWQQHTVPHFKMAINISARQFWQGNLAEVFAKILQETGVDPACIELELTESMLMRHTEETIEMLNRLRSLGLNLSIDDFGTGYSSLSYLKRFPIQKLKIDRSFIRDITHDPDDAAITEAIIAMGRSLKMTVIAEGVETIDQLTYLRNHHCDEGQGYYFSKPTPASDCTALLQTQQLSLVG